MPAVSANLNDLWWYIGQAFDQIQWGDCEPCLNGVFWRDYKYIREGIKQILNANGVRGSEYNNLMRTRTLTELTTIGWRGDINGDGCVEFYKCMPGGAM